LSIYYQTISGKSVLAPRHAKWFDEVIMDLDERSLGFWSRT